MLTKIMLLRFSRNSDLIAVTKPVNGVFKVVDLSTFMPYDAVTRPIEAVFNKKTKQTPQAIDRFLQIQCLIEMDQ